MRVRFSILLVLVSVLGCGAPLPESYGVYARDGRHLVELTWEVGEAQFQLSSSATILVFDRALSQPGFDPSDAFRLFRAGFSRYVHATHLEPTPAKALELLNARSVSMNQIDDLPISATRVAPSGRWIRLGEPLPIRLGPIDNRNDLMALSPVEPLRQGAFILQLDVSGRTSSYLFGVDLAGTDEERHEAACVDEYLYTVRRPDGFLGWDQWLKDVAEMGRSRRMSEGRPVVAESTLTCGQADSLGEPRVLAVTVKQDTQHPTARTFQVEYTLPPGSSDVSLGATAGISTREKQPVFNFDEVRLQPGRHTVDLKVSCFRDWGASQVTTDYLHVFFFRAAERGSFYSQRVEQTYTWSAERR